MKKKEKKGMINSDTRSNVSCGWKLEGQIEKKKGRTNGSLKFLMRILLFYTLCVNLLLARRFNKDNYNLIRVEFRYS